MDDVEKLVKLSLVSKVCMELENHLGMSDKNLGEELGNVINFCKIICMFFS